MGEYKNDKRNGKGTLTTATAETYTGYFLNDERDGKGINKC